MKSKTIPWLLAIAAAVAGLCLWLHRSAHPDRDSVSRSAPPDRGIVHSANENGKALPPALHLLGERAGVRASVGPQPPPPSLDALSASIRPIVDASEDYLKRQSAIRALT